MSEETIWDQEGVSVISRDSEDELSKEYTIVVNHPGFDHIYPWTDNPQELAIAARHHLTTDRARAEVTMFLKQEKNWNTYGVRV